MTAQYPGSESWSCTIDHFDGAGNRIPCPDSLVVSALEVVEAHRKPRLPFTGWDLDPTPHGLAWFGLGVCVGVLLLALLILGRVAIDGVGS